MTKPPDLALLLAKRKATDPCLNYTLSPNQRRFLHSTARFRTIQGGNRTGKTLCADLDLALEFRNLHPVRRPSGHRLRFLALTNTRAQASQVFGRKLLQACEMPGPFHDHPLIPKYEIAELSELKVGLRVPYYVRHRNGNELIFAWSGADATWERIQGMKIDRVYLDEDAGLEKLIDELFMRGLDSRSDASDPFGGSMTWSATPTVGSDAFQKFKAFCEDPGEKDTAYYFLKPEDNPTITEEHRSQARRFLGEEAAAVRVDGTASALDFVLIYGKQWDDNRHVLKTEYTPAPEDNLWLGYDPGVDHPTGMVIVAVSPSAPITCKVVKTWSHSRQTLDYDIRCLSEYLCGRRLAGIVYDTAANNMDKTGSSVLQHLHELLVQHDMYPFAGTFPAQKRHWHGISVMRHYLDPDPYDKTVPALLVFNPSCGKIRSQMLGYRGKESTRFTGAGGVVKKNDDEIDALRYVVVRRPAYNPVWQCGKPTRILREDGPPLDLTAAPPPSPSMTYQTALMVRPMRPRDAAGRGWTAVDF